MNYIKHLSGFFDKVSKDDRLNPTHISLYVSLFQFWNACRFHNPISISRNEAMKVSKICSKATYHKCIRELNDYGYLSYHPSYNPFKGSLVYLFDFKTSDEQVLNRSHTKIETITEQALNGERTKIGTSTEQALVPYINNTNINKHKTEVNERELSLKINDNISSNPDKRKIKKEGKEKSCAKKEKFIPPEFSEVQEYFASQKFSAIDASKFFNHFKSNGWLVAGKTPMKDWQAAANKWIINNENFNHKAGNLHATTGKDYSEPL